MPRKSRIKPTTDRPSAATAEVDSVSLGDPTEKAKSTVKQAPSVQAVPLPSRCRVYVNDGSGNSWAETTEVVIMSRFGASFDLTRECRLGTLIKVEIPLAPELRAFDHDKEMYRVVGLVQHSSPPVTGLKQTYHLSVIFVGKVFPDSYFSNPQQTYRLSSSVGNGVWKVTECSNGIKQRRYPRFSVELNVEMGLIHRHERNVMWEKTETCDVSSVGVSVITSLPAIVGDKVKFSCKDLDFHAIATVVKRRNFFGFRDVLHLKFVDDRFPVERLLFSQVDGRQELTLKR